jgi:hypothetical protein
LTLNNLSVIILSAREAKQILVLVHKNNKWRGC